MQETTCVNKSKKIVVALVGALMFFVVLGWTPVLDHMPQIIVMVLLQYGGVLTKALPIILMLTAIWVFRGRRKKNASDQ
jgi:hypothetical protein